MSNKQIYGFKKSKAFGLCSVMLASFMLASGVGQVSADEHTISVSDLSTVSTSESNQVPSVVNSTTSTEDEKVSVESEISSATSEETLASSESTSQSTLAASSDSQKATSDATPTALQSTLLASEAGVSSKLASEALPELTTGRESQAPTHSAAGKPLPESEKNQLTSATVEGKHLSLQYNKEIKKGEEIQFAVWSKGYEDMIWYTADNTGAAYIDLSRHKALGRYNVHTYSKVNGQLSGLNGRTVEVPRPSGVTATASEVDLGQFKVLVSGVDDAVSSVTIPVWSNSNGGDDLKWYTATKESNGTYSVLVKTANHRGDTGLYFADVYGKSAISGELLSLTGTTFTNKTPISTKVSSSLTDKGIAIQLSSNAVGDFSKVSFAVWSDVNGGDDLKWYSANKAGYAMVPYANHSGYGKYFIHTYSNESGKPVGIDGTSFTIEKPAVQTTITKINEENFKVTVSNVPHYISSITLPTWSDINGGDDMQWVSAKKDKDGTYSAILSVRDHHMDRGHYSVHVYGTSLLEGNAFIGLGGSEGFSYDKPVVNTVESKLTDRGIAIKLTSNTVGDLTKVSFAVWSDVNGGDDLKWYNASKDGAVLVPYTNHTGYGKYFIHTYSNETGKPVALNATEIAIPKPNVKSKVSKINDVTYQVTISDVPVYVSNITVPTWSDRQGGNGLRWISAQKNTDGTYTANINLRYHDFATGKYFAHIYGVSQLENNASIGLGATEGFVASPENVVVEKPKAEVVNYDKTQGRLTVKISESDYTLPIKSARIAAWSKADGSNIHWYNATPVNGMVTVEVRENFHHYLGGDYTVHAYVTLNNGKEEAYNLGTYTFDEIVRPMETKVTYRGTGNYKIEITALDGIKEVNVAVWSEVNGGDDLKWYSAPVVNGIATVNVSALNHKGTGTYNIHTYIKDGPYLTKSTFNVSRDTYSTPYYSQRDGRWGGRYYGAFSMGQGGCVPTSLAMVFSSLAGREILPTEIADYLHYTTGQFNIGGLGTNSDGIVSATKKYGYQASVLNTLNQVTTALQEGYHVLAAVQNNIFVRNGSHEIVLKGYSNGKTYVSDPYTPSLSGWYSVTQLWNEQSRFAEDRLQGAPFFKITDA